MDCLQQTAWTQEADYPLAPAIGVGSTTAVLREVKEPKADDEAVPLLSPEDVASWSKARCIEWLVDHIHASYEPSVTKAEYGLELSTEHLRQHVVVQSMVARDELDRHWSGPFLVDEDEVDADEYVEIERVLEVMGGPEDYEDDE